MTKFKELHIPESPSAAEVKGEIKSTSQNIPLRAVISIYDLLSTAQESGRLTAPCISGQNEPLEGSNEGWTQRLGHSSFVSKASLFFTFMFIEDPELSHSLLKLAWRAIKDRKRTVLRPSSAENSISPKEENIQKQESLIGDLPIIEHLAFHPTVPILALTTSLSTIHLYDLENESLATYFLSPASTCEKGRYPKITTLAFSSAGLLAVGLSTGVVDIWTIDLSRTQCREVSISDRNSLFVPPHLTPEWAACKTGYSLRTRTHAPSLSELSGSKSPSKSTSVISSWWEDTPCTVSPTQMGPAKGSLKRSATCSSISLISQSPYLARTFRPQEILGAITSLSFSPSGRHLAIGTEKAGLWHYNTILKGVTNILPGQGNVKCLCWGSPLSSTAFYSASGQLGYNSPPDVTYIVAGLAGGGAAYFKVREYGVALRFTGGSITLLTPTLHNQVGLESRNSFLPDIQHILIAPIFDKGYKSDPLEALPNEQGPLILLSRQDTDEIQVFRVGDFTTPLPLPTLESFQSLRKHTIWTIWTYIWPIICHNFCMCIYLILNKTSKFLEVQLVSDGTGFHAKCIGRVDVHYVNRSGVSVVPSVPLTPPITDELTEPTKWPPPPPPFIPINQDETFQSSSVGIEHSHEVMEPSTVQGGTNLQTPKAVSTYVPTLQTDKLQTVKDKGTFLQKGYGGRVASMIMDREGRRLFVRFEHQGEISTAIFDTSNAYHFTELGFPLPNDPNQRKKGDGEENSGTHKNGPASLYDLGEKLLSPLGVLVPQTPIGENMATVGPVEGKSVLSALRLFGSSRVEVHLKDTLMEPYIDGELRKMHQEEGNEARAVQKQNKGKGKEGVEIIDEGFTEALDGGLDTVGIAAPRRVSKKYTQVGEVGITKWKRGGIIGMVLGEDENISGGNRVGFVTSIWE